MKIFKAYIIILILLFTTASCMKEPVTVNSKPLPSIETAIINVDTIKADESSETISEGDLIVVFIDVGQGSSTFIVLPNGETVLIDAGDSSAVDNIIEVITYYSDTGKIDYLVATHPHADHIGGMVDIINTFDIGTVLRPNVSHNSRIFEHFMDSVEELPLIFAFAEVVLFDFGYVSAVFVSPNNDKYSNLNDYSSSVLLTYNEISMLFMGDNEDKSIVEIIENSIDISADILLISHHGSRTGSSHEFIEIVNPKYGIISSGIGNSYGHPHEEVINMLLEYNIIMLETAKDGNIVIMTCGVIGCGMEQCFVFTS